MGKRIPDGLTMLVVQMDMAREPRIFVCGFLLRFSRTIDLESDNMVFFHSH